MAEIKDLVSKRFSLKGYNWNVWLSKNKDSIKQIVSLVLGILGTSLGTLFATNNQWYALLLMALFGSVSAAGSKMILDAVDYFLSEVVIE